MRLPRADDGRQSGVPIAAEDASRLAVEAGPLLERATNVEWYELPGSDIDRAALTLFRLRRVMAGASGSPRRGDAAVRDILSRASPEALVWFASRTVSYLDENVFPDAVAPWLHEQDVPE